MLLMQILILFVPFYLLEIFCQRKRLHSLKDYAILALLALVFFALPGVLLANLLSSL